MGGAGDQPNTDPVTTEDGKIPGFLRFVFVLLAIAVVGFTLYLWLMEPDASLQRTRQVTMERHVTPRTAKKHSRASRTTYSRVVKTTRTADGTVKPGEVIGSASEADRRSETLTFVLLGGALLVLLVAAAGRVPQSVGKEGVVFGEETQRHAAAALATAAVEKDQEEAEELQPDELKAGARMLYAKLAVDPGVRAVSARAPRGPRGWLRRRRAIPAAGVSPSDDLYLTALARESLDRVRPPSGTRRGNGP